MNKDSLSAWLHLQQLPNMHYQQIQPLLDATDDVTEIIDTLKQPVLWQKLTSKQQQSLLKANQSRIDASLAWLEQSSQHFVLAINSPGYPALLKEIPHPPLVLFGKGNRGVLDMAHFAMVGSRNASRMALDKASELARQLAQSGWVINSGLAIGVDAAAHRGALLANAPTVAVLGTGIDLVYPRRHIKLAEEIVASGGCLVSEFTPGTPPLAHHFPKRNRIISGLSRGVLVVAAALKSGSLITAKYALEQNREIFALPGNIDNPLSKGCHALLKQGAKLVEQIQDINDEFPSIGFCSAAETEKKLQKSAEQRLATDKLLDSVDFETTTLDVVTQRSGMPLTAVLAKLLEYELSGLVASVPGGYIKLGER